jgi:hypothetical protein
VAGIKVGAVGALVSGGLVITQVSVIGFVGFAAVAAAPIVLAVGGLTAIGLGIYFLFKKSKSP